LIKGLGTEIDCAKPLFGSMRGNKKENRFHSYNHEKSSKCLLTAPFFDAIIKNIHSTFNKDIDDD